MSVIYMYIFIQKYIVEIHTSNIIIVKNHNAIDYLYIYIGLHAIVESRI